MTGRKVYGEYKREWRETFIGQLNLCTRAATTTTPVSHDYYWGPLTGFYFPFPRLFPPFILSTHLCLYFPPVRPVSMGEEFTLLYRTPNDTHPIKAQDVVVTLQKNITAIPSSTAIDT